MDPRTTGSPLVRIGVMGVGGAGGNAVNRMTAERATPGSAGSIFNDIVVLAANTDTQDLEKSSGEVKIQLGANLTGGWGAGARPEVGRQSAEESRIEIANAIDGLDMLFITAGMGGGTGTGASPIIAQIAKESGILTVGVVTTPFQFEAKKKMRVAQEGVEQLREQVDTLVVIPNEKLVAIADDRATYAEMFRRSDEVLINAVRSLATLIANKSLVNVDFADVRTTMIGMGVAMIGIGAAAGEDAAITAVKEALNNPLLSDVSIKGARRALLHLSGMSIPIKELDAAANYISTQLHEDADFIWGVSSDEAADKIYALVVAEATKVAAPTAVPTATGATAARSGNSGGNTAAAANRAALKESQSNIFDMAGNAPVPEPVATPVAAPLTAAAVKTEVKGVDYSEPILYKLPADHTPFDRNNKDVPAFLRKQMQAQAAATVAAPPPLPRDAVATAERNEASPVMVQKSDNNKHHGAE